MAHQVLGLFLISTNRAAQGIAECERALALDRNLAPAHGAIGLAKYSMGLGEETECHVQEALRLSPRDTSAYRWMMYAGFAKLLLGADEEATREVRPRPVEMNRNFPLAHFISPPRWRILAGSMRRGPRFRPGLPSIPLSPSPASARARRATIRPI